MSAIKKSKMVAFWSNRAKLFDSDPRANTNDIWLREIEISYVDKVIKTYAFKRIMDFGCANGYTTSRLGRLNPESEFVGVDINSDMIAVANKHTKANGNKNLKFTRVDILSDEATENYDFVYTIRVLQNIESPEMQKRIFDRLHDLVRPRGMFLYIESYLDGYTRLNEDRVNMGLAPLPIHEHLTLLTEEFDSSVSGKMELISRNSLSSSYYLITRLLYAYIAKTNDEPIDYNHPIHQVATMVPQIGDYGPLVASLYRKS
jgi:SAM-dependent methyltransferase